MADNCLGLPLVNRKSKSYLFFVASVLEFRALKIKDFPPPCCPETVIPKLAATKQMIRNNFMNYQYFGQIYGIHPINDIKIRGEFIIIGVTRDG